MLNTLKRNTLSKIPARTAFLALVTAAILSMSVAAVRADEESEVLTNKSIVELHELGFGEEVIVEKIKNTRCEFEVGIENLKTLKEAGVPSGVISAMINADSSGESDEVRADPNDPQSPHESGIYVYRVDREEAALEKIEPSMYTQTKSGGFMKSALTYGAVKAKMKAVLAGTGARVVVGSKPTFYFYFEETQTGLSSQNQGMIPGQRTYTNPGEFVLAQFKVKQKKKNRELVVAKIGAFGGVQSGAIDETVRQFDYEKLSPGIFKVTTREVLEAGEYCFYYGGSATPIYGFWGGGNQVFDFGVRSR